LTTVEERGTQLQVATVGHRKDAGFGNIREGGGRNLTPREGGAVIKMEDVGSVFFHKLGTYRNHELFLALCQTIVYICCDVIKTSEDVFIHLQGSVRYNSRVPDRRLGFLSCVKNKTEPVLSRPAPFRSCRLLTGGCASSRS